ncbi:3-methyl-2-oxobutanoate hydroxymethyltransferase [bacterium]|nr:3-methyl-2-oxobutanoate hydroxymethyltransferase [candidate division CSSED10-310 bacterium]
MLEKVTAPAVAMFKRRGRKIAMLTAYDFIFAQLADRAGIDIVLVGDSLGNVILGHETTLPVTMADMLHHTKAVSRGVQRALVVADMPFLSYHLSPRQALRNAGRFVKQAGAAAVKVEGGSGRAEVIKRLVESEIPVMGHIGLTPQSYHRFGGYRVQGKSAPAAERLLEDAHALAAAGVFSLVLEGIPWELGKRITAALEIPTIGIGAGPCCDGQVLVLHDMLGLTAAPPKFVRRFAALDEVVTAAMSRYCADVRDGTFPTLDHSYTQPSTSENAEQGDNS